VTQESGPLDDYRAANVSADEDEDKGSLTPSAIGTPRTPFGRLRARFDARIEEARASGATAAELDALYVGAAAARNMDRELKRLRRQVQTRSVGTVDVTIEDPDVTLTAGDDEAAS